MIKISEQKILEDIQTLVVCLALLDKLLVNFEIRLRKIEKILKVKNK